MRHASDPIENSVFHRRYHGENARIAQRSDDQMDPSVVPLISTAHNFGRQVCV